MKMTLLVFYRFKLMTHFEKPYLYIHTFENRGLMKNEQNQNGLKHNKVNFIYNVMPFDPGIRIFFLCVKN